MSAPGSSTPEEPGGVGAPAVGTPAVGTPAVGTRAAAWGLGLGLLLILAAYLVPKLTGWEVMTHGRVYTDNVPPLHSRWSPTAFGPGTLPALAIAALGLWRAGHWAASLSWRRLLVVAYAGSLAWMLALALVDGTEGLSRVLGNPYEYLMAAREVSDVPAMLAEFTSRIPYAAEDNWVTHVAGHPPGALLFFVVLVQLGLGGDLVAGVVVTVLAATTAPAVLDTLRTLDAEDLARRCAPLLVLAPGAVWMAVSADALFTATAAWGLAALARGAVAVRGGRRAWWGWGVLAGVLLGCCVMFSYGLPLLGPIALGVLAAAATAHPGARRVWLLVPVAAAAASAVVLAYVPFGYEFWSAYPVLRERYWDGTASERPFAYWSWGNLANLLLAAGPVLAAALAHAGALVRARGLGDVLRPGGAADTPVRTGPGTGVATAVRPGLRSGLRPGLRTAHEVRVAVLIAGSAAVAVAIADLSRMSKAETERIWLPFVPWLLVATALLPERWRQAGLAIGLLIALVAQHLLYTSW